MIRTGSHPPPRDGPRTPAPAGRAGEEAARSVAALTRTFVGREAEIAELRAGLEEAETGRGRTFLVVGEPGIGKTRLVEELASEAPSDRVRAYWGRCWESGGAPAYWPWIEIVRSLIRDRGLGAAVREMEGAAPYLAEIVPELRDLAPDLPTVPEPLDAEEGRFALFEAITTLVATASTSTTLLLVLDDLHAADPPSLRVLRFLARALPKMRVLVVGTYRELEATKQPQVGTLLTEVGREGTTIRVSGLAPSQVGQMVGASSASPVPERLVAELHRATDGNPLFVSEVLRLLASEDRLGRSDVALGTVFPTSEAIRHTIRRRLELVLSEEARGMLQAAATLGHDFELWPLRHAADLPPGRVVEALAEAVDARVVTEVPGAVGRYRFLHTMMRDTVYEEVPLASRLRLHLRIGEALEERYRGNVEAHLTELAYHFSKAAPITNADKAIRYTIRAAERAEAVFAYEEAAAGYELALHLFDLLDPPDEARRAEVLLALGHARNRAGELDRAKQTFLLAADTARALRAPELLARAAVGYGSETFTTGVVDWPLVHLLEEALEEFGEQESALRVDVATRLAFELYYADARERRIALSEEAVEMARRLGDPLALSYALETRALAGAGPDNVEERLEAGTEIIRLAQEHGPRQRRQTGHHWRVTALLELGDITEADREIDAYARLAEEFRQRAHLWYSAVLRATRALFSGRFEQGERLAQEALRIGSSARGEEAEEYFAVQRFTLARELGRQDELRAMESTFAELASRYARLPALRAALACIYLELGRGAAARSELEVLGSRRFSDLPRDVGLLATLALLAEVAHAVGDARSAEALRELLLPYAEHNVVFDWSIACLGSASRYLGLLAATMGRVEEAKEHFETAIGMNARMGARPYLAHAQEEFAKTLLATNDPGQRESARRLMQEGLAGYEDLGMDAHADRARALLAGLESPEPAAAPAEPRAAILRREGEYWSLAFEGVEFRLKDSKGLRYVAELLRHPGSEFHVLDLVGAMEGGAGIPSARRGRGRGEAEVRADVGDAGAVLDAQAKAAYRRRLEDLQEDLREAEEWGDIERAARAREEMDFLARELAAAVGLGGRDRKAASAAERARVNVTKVIRAAVERIADQSPALAHHLATTIRTGTFCSYDPGPRPAISWEV